MTVAVTGATGFVGSHVARALVAGGDEVRVLVRPGADLRAIRDLAVAPVAGDLRNRASLSALVRGARRVFHVAADYRLWARNPHELFETNVAGTKNLLDVCRDEAVERIVYTSTVGTIAVSRPGPLPNEATEAHLYEMTGAYKQSKFLAERAVRAAAAQGLPVVIVNPTTPVGPGDWKPTPTGRMLLDFVRGRIPAYVDTGLNLVAVEDVARGHLLAAERGVPGERYLLGGRNVALRELWEILARITGRKVPSLRIPHALAMAVAFGSELVASVRGREPFVPLDAARMARHTMYVDAGKAERALGFAAGPIEAALERAVRWFVDNGYVAPAAGRRRSAMAGGLHA